MPVRVPSSGRSSCVDPVGMRSLRSVLLVLILPASGEKNDAARRVEQAKVLGASYPDGANGVGLLLDMLDDDDPAVRQAASQSLVALGREGLGELVRCLTNPRDPGYPVLLKIGEIATRLGPALTPGDLCEPMCADEPVSRRAGAAVAVLAASFPTEDRDLMIDTLTTLWRREGDASVTAMSSASLAVVGWTVECGALGTCSRRTSRRSQLTVPRPRAGINRGACGCERGCRRSSTRAA